MPIRKVRVEVVSGSGDRYTITFEGHVTREKALRLLDLIELLGGMPGVHPELSGGEPSELSKFDKIRLIVERHFPLTWFSSREVQLAYEREFKESISLSTVSTYLSRMVDRGILVKAGAPNHRRYRMIPELARSLIPTR